MSGERGVSWDGVPEHTVCSACFFRSYVSPQVRNELPAARIAACHARGKCQAAKAIEAVQHVLRCHQDEPHDLCQAKRKALRRAVVCVCEGQDPICVDDSPHVFDDALREVATEHRGDSNRWAPRLPLIVHLVSHAHVARRHAIFGSMYDPDKLSPTENAARDHTLSLVLFAWLAYNTNLAGWLVKYFVENLHMLKTTQTNLGRAMKADHFTRTLFNSDVFTHLLHTDSPSAATHLLQSIAGILKHVYHMYKHKPEYNTSHMRHWGQESEPPAYEDIESN